MFLAYIFLGFTISLPVCAISIEMTKQGLQKGFLSSWAVGLGSFIIDICLLILLIMGLADVLNKVQLYLWLIGAIFLTHLAWQSIKSDCLSVDKGVSEFSKDSFFKLFKRGFMMGLNPSNIIFWISVSGTSISSAKANSEMGIVAVSVAILLGIALHDVSLAFLSSRFNRFMTPKSNRIISILAGILLLGFAIHFFNQFLHEASFL